jgi:hypothetical protein
MVEIAVAFVASHLGGMALGGLLGRNELLGFGVKAMKAAAQRRAERRHEKARDDLKAWLDEKTDSAD